MLFPEGECGRLHAAQISKNLQNSNWMEPMEPLVLSNISSATKLRSRGAEALANRIPRRRDMVTLVSLESKAGRPIEDLETLATFQDFQECKIDRVIECKITETDTRMSFILISACFHMLQFQDTVPKLLAVCCLIRPLF